MKGFKSRLVMRNCLLRVDTQPLLGDAEVIRNSPALVSTNATGSRNAIARISQRPFTRANGHHLRQATHKPVAGSQTRE
jgi:hypothetical protein